MKKKIDRLKTLVDDKEYFESDNIWYEQSKVCINDEGEILGFVLIKPHTLYDFFGGEITDEENVEERKKYKDEYKNNMEM